MALLECRSLVRASDLEPRTIRYRHHTEELGHVQASFNAGNRQAGDDGKIAKRTGACTRRGPTIVSGDDGIPSMLLDTGPGSRKTV